MAQFYCVVEYPEPMIVKCFPATITGEEKAKEYCKKLSQKYSGATYKVEFKEEELEKVVQHISFWKNVIHLLFHPFKK